MNTIKQIEIPLGASVTPLKKGNRKIKFITSKGISIVAKPDILCLKSSSNYTEIYFADGSKICCSQTMKSVFNRLNDSSFYRPHNSYVVNIYNIEGVNNTISEITLTNGMLIPISRSKKVEFKSKLELWYD